MNFSDLLDEDGQGTRGLDKWLREHLTDNYIEDYSAIPAYTTGGSIDPIWELAKEYFDNAPSLRGHTLPKDKENTFSCGAWRIDNYTESWSYKDEKLAIAEALFKAYQKEEE